jgi:thioredoxin 1
MSTVELTSENFASAVADADLALVDFWATWCGPCRMFGPIFDRVSERHTDALFGKVDTDAQQELAAQFGISSIPTLMVIRDNVILFSQAGALPEQALEELITKAQELDMDEVRASIEQHEHDQHGHAHEHEEHEHEHEHEQHEHEHAHEGQASGA